MRKRVAITLPAGPDLADNIEVVRWAEDSGFDDAWFSDAMAPDSLTMVAAVAPHARRMRLGVAVTPVYTRTPAVLAATANVLGQLLPGRFALGLGSSSQAIMERFNGIPLQRPLTRVKETAIIVRSMLAGEKSDFALETLSSRGYSQTPLEHPVPLLLAGLRPKMIEMAAEHGDGVVFNLWPRKALPRMLEHVAAGAARAGKTVEELEILNRAMVYVTDDVEDGRARFRHHFAPYYANPVYNDFLKWAGYEAEAQEILDGWAARDRNRTTAALTDEIVDEVAIIGTRDQVAEKVREQAAAGIDTTIVAPIGMPPPGPEEAKVTYRAFTSDVFSFD